MEVKALDVQVVLWAESQRDSELVGHRPLVPDPVAELWEHELLA